jgi:hypothetical protein
MCVYLFQGIHVCINCGEILRSRSLLDTHYRRHRDKGERYDFIEMKKNWRLEEGAKKYQCEYCDYYSTCNEALYAHRKGEHRDTVKVYFI